MVPQMEAEEIQQGWTSWLLFHNWKLKRFNKGGAVGYCSTTEDCRDPTIVDQLAMVPQKEAEEIQQGRTSWLLFHNWKLKRFNKGGAVDCNDWGSTT